MEKEVFVTIEGTQVSTEEEVITEKIQGQYYLRNGKHFITGTGTVFKISSERVELTKKGSEYSQMVFDLTETTRTIYQTPYGSLPLEIKTTMLQIMETEREIKVILRYTLSAQEEYLSDNKILIRITPEK